MFKLQANLSTLHLKRFLGILILAGLLKYPQYRMYWDSTTKVAAISEAMSVNRFESLKRFFHVNNNDLAPKKDDENYDVLYKVRPMLDSIVKKYRNLE